jgi:hypothetical protein
MDSPVISSTIGDRILVSGGRGSPSTEAHSKNSTKIVPPAGPVAPS